MSFKNRFLAIFLIGALAISCGDGGGGDAPVQDGDAAPKQDTKEDGSALMEIEGKMFSFPSPVQTAILIKDIGTDYDASLMNDPNAYSKYSTSFKRAINLGIYGADLGYANIYEQAPDALKYFKSVKMIGDELGVTASFDENLLKRFNDNLGNKDSLLAMVADAFRASDAYLKNNERSDVGALVLAGGWVESLYFTTNIANSTNNAELVSRIAAQKNTCNNLVKLMMPYYNKADYTAFIDQLMELNEVFQGIEVVYTWEEPTVDEANKTTTINSKTEYRVSTEQLNDITNKIKIIREDLIS